MLRNKNYLMLIIFLLSFIYCAKKKSAESLPVYHCYKISEAIVIDGNVIEEVWKKGEEGHFINQGGSIPELKTTFKWLWDDNYLYGAFHVEDDDIWSTRTTYDDSLWLEEVVEFFIDADGCPKTYAEFEINPLNTILDLYILNKYNNRKDIYQLWKWDCKGLKSAVKVVGTVDNRNDTDQYWDFEVAIPLNMIYTAPNVPPVVGDKWKIDFCRGENRKDGKFIATSWSPPAFHNPLSYGTIIFEGSK